MQLDLFPDAPVDNCARARDGFTWWVDNHECRNWRGWFQSREGGSGNWCFQVYGFGDTDASVYAVTPEGELTVARCVPIDRRNRLLIEGRRWGPEHWNH